MHSCLYEFFRDQGSVIGGILALLAGVALYVVGRMQVAAVNRQNDFLRRSERRRLATETLVAARLFGGVIENLTENMATTTSPSNPIDVRLEDIPLYEVVDHLGKLSRESIYAYYLLSRKIQEYRTFRTRPNTTAEQTKHKFDELQTIAKHVTDQIAEDGKKAQAVLANTQDD